VNAAIPDQAAAERFLRELVPEDQPGHLVLFSLPSRESRAFRSSALAHAASVAANLGARENVYFGCGLQAEEPPAGSRGDKNGVCAIPGVWADLDVRGPAHAADDLPPSVDAALELLAELPLPPTLVVSSGYGLQPWWLFREPWTFEDAAERERAQALVRGWQGALQAQAAQHGWRLDAVHDLARVLRLPGTFNRKLKTAVPVTVLTNSGPRFNPLDFEEFIVAPAAENGTDRKSAAPEVEDRIPEGRRNSRLASIAGTMRRRGLAEPEILALLREVNMRRCSPPLPEDELVAITLSVCQYEPAEPVGGAAESTDVLRIEVMTAKALCERPDPPDDGQLVGPLLVRGQRLIVGAHTGEGKTTLMLQLMRAFVNRGPFLDWEGAGGKALIVDVEQGERTVKRRLREAGLDNSERVDYVRVPDGLSLDKNAHHVAEVTRVLEEGGYDAVCMDPLYKLHTGDPNAEREAVDLMKRLDAWRDTYGFALVLPVHCRKPLPGTKFSIHDLFGASAYVRGAEVILGLRRVSDGYAKLHFLKDRDGDLSIGTAWGLLFQRETGFTRDPKDGVRETTADRLAELLAEEPGMTEEQLASALKVTVRTIRRAKKELRERDESESGEEG
jgi:hypothetical protein